jgi:glucokinase
VSLFFGVDIGGTNVKTAVVSDTGDILYKHSFETLAERGMEDLCRRLKETLVQGLDTIGRSYDEVAGVGVGLPGFLDIENGVIIDLVNLGWSNIPFIPIAEDVLGLKVVMENDANVAALGESWTGAGRGAKSVVCVTVGTGVGGGIVINQRLYRGVNGLAGEIGHLVVDRDGYPCNCGRRGCLETLASATAIIRRARELQQAGELDSSCSITGAEDVFHLAALGHDKAIQVIHEAADWLGYGLALVANTINPDVIVVGGGVSKAGESFLQPVASSFRKYALPLVAETAALRLAQLGNDAGVIGAARLISQRVLA